MVYHSYFQCVLYEHSAFGYTYVHVYLFVFFLSSLIVFLSMSYCILYYRHYDDDDDMEIETMDTTVQTTTGRSYCVIAHICKMCLSVLTTGRM